MGTLNVDEMLRGMTAKQFAGWQAYALLEPFSERRQDYRVASIIKALWDIARDTKKHPKPFKLDDFVLDFEEKETKVEVINRPPTQEELKDKMRLLTSMFSGVPLSKINV